MKKKIRVESVKTFVDFHAANMELWSLNLMLTGAVKTFCNVYLELQNAKVEIIVNCGFCLNLT